MSQKTVFASGEGDAWFSRNAAHLKNIDQAMQSEDVRYICEALNPLRDGINRVLEIGCSNGIKLEAICHHFGAVGYGLEPSALAVQAGNAREKLSEITLSVGAGDDLPYESAQFDLVYFAFCLYLFDRETLIESLSEANRVLKPGGFLVITDFDPGGRYKRGYSHRDGVMSYKQDYSGFFVQSGLYYMAGKKCFSHRRTYFDDLPDERVSTTLLFKEVDPYPTHD